MPVLPRRGWSIAACLFALLLLAGCGFAATQPLPSATVSPAGATQILPSATVSPAATAEPAAELATSPLPTAGAAREPLQLVVLHSNDNWGETEPCG
jgi:hypothetical protein